MLVDFKMICRPQKLSRYEKRSRCKSMLWRNARDTRERVYFVNERIYE